LVCLESTSFHSNTQEGDYPEFRQQIKIFRLKYVFLAGKIIRSARYVVMKLPAKYPYKDVYEKCLA